MKPILKDVPYSFETERLTIRGPLPGDGVRVRTAVQQSHDALKQWMPWAIEIPSEESYEVRVREGHLNYLGRKDFWLLLFLKGTDTLIGSSGLHVRNWDVPSFEIGYWVHSHHTGKGYVTEAVNGICQFGFTELQAERLFIRCDAQNERSAAVARRCGFTFEGTHHHDARHHLTNELRDTLYFCKLPPSD